MSMSMKGRSSLPVASRLSAEFAHDVRNRGASYLNRVVSLTGDEHSLIARVRGQQLYSVIVRREGACVEGSCTCPYFSDTGPCKHLWAVFLCADYKELLRRAQGDRERLHLHEPGDIAAHR